MIPASIRDVAAAAGVSVGTVSNVLNRPSSVAEKTAERVLQAIEDLGYVRNDAARQLRAGRSSSVGLIVLDAGNPFFADLARGAEEEAARAGVSVILGNSDENADRESGYLALFEEQRVRGVLISPIGDVDARLAMLRERGTPVVLVDRRSDDDALSSVSMDDIAGGRLAAQHLLDRGRRRLAFVGGPVEIRQVSDRLSGARDAVSSHPDAQLEVLDTAGLSVLEGRRIGSELSALPPSERPDAIFAANDLVAIGLLQALVMLGRLAVPDDIAIIGYDDIGFAATTVVPLSSVRQPSRLIGETAIRILLDESDDATLARQTVVFGPELVARDSTLGATPA